MNRAIACGVFLVGASGVLLAGCSRTNDYGPMYVTPFPATAPAPGPAPTPAPAVFITPASDPAAESKVELLESRGTLRGTNLRVADLVSIAYRTPEGGKSRLPSLSAYRVESRTPLPAVRYDVRVDVPGGRAAQLRAALRDGLRRTLGITAFSDWREVDALALVAPGGRTRLPAAALAPVQPPRPPGTDRLALDGDDVSLLAEQLEEHLKYPVVNETGLRGSYRLYVDVPAGPRRGGELAMHVDVLRAALRQQLGLELVPARRRVEFLITAAARSPR